MLHYRMVNGQIRSMESDGGPYWNVSYPTAKAGDFASELHNSGITRGRAALVSSRRAHRGVLTGRPFLSNPAGQEAFATYDVARTNQISMERIRL